MAQPIYCANYYKFLFLQTIYSTQMRAKDSGMFTF
jgi:hypothetical protein